MKIRYVDIADSRRKSVTIATSRKRPRKEGRIDHPHTCNYSENLLNIGYIYIKMSSFQQIDHTLYVNFIDCNFHIFSASCPTCTFHPTFHAPPPSITFNYLRIRQR